ERADLCFFFQAEDGIRDFHVTGVQTCALPIFAERCLAVRLPADLSIREFDKRLHMHMSNAALNRWLRSPAGPSHCHLLGIAPPRSEERRVGSGWSPAGAAARALASRSAEAATP